MNLTFFTNQAAKQSKTFKIEFSETVRRRVSRERASIFVRRTNAVQECLILFNVIDRQQQASLLDSVGLHRECLVSRFVIAGKSRFVQSSCCLCLKKPRKAGSGRGSLFGRGLYFAEARLDHTCFELSQSAFSNLASTPKDSPPTASECSLQGKLLEGR